MYLILLSGQDFLPPHESEKENDITKVKVNIFRITTHVILTAAYRSFLFPITSHATSFGQVQRV